MAKQIRAYVVENAGPNRNGLEVVFTDRPSVETTDALKALGCWWNFYPRAYRAEIGLRRTVKFAGAWYVRGFPSLPPDMRTGIGREIAKLVERFNANPVPYKEPAKAARKAGKKAAPARKRTRTTRTRKGKGKAV